MIKLYHGTSEGAAEEIEEAGIIEGPVYLTPRLDVAESYGDVVLEVKADRDDLQIDFDLPGGRLLTVKEANAYAGNEDWSIDDYLAEGQSVGFTEDLKL